eukprot:2930327-Pyramimonas_sp.AAC.1
MSRGGAAHLDPRRNNLRQRAGARQTNEVRPNEREPRARPTLVGIDVYYVARTMWMTRRCILAPRAACYALRPQRSWAQWHDYNRSQIGPFTSASRMPTSFVRGPIDFVQVVSLCEACQSVDPKERPTFSQISEVLSKVETRSLETKLHQQLKEKRLLHEILPAHVRLLPIFTL